MPSQRFAVNAAWFKLALLSYNLASAIKELCFDPEERTMRFKKYRFQPAFRPPGSPSPPCSPTAHTLGEDLGLNIRLARRGTWP